MSKELTPELKKQIAVDSIKYESATQHEGLGPAIYRDGATIYAELWQEAEQKIKELTQWKKEASWLLDPLLEWGQGRKDIPLGADITKEILRRAKLFTEGEQKAERYEKALREIAMQMTCAEQQNDPDREMDDNLSKLGDIEYGYDCCIEVAREALTPKQTTDGE